MLHVAAMHAKAPTWQDNRWFGHFRPRPLAPRTTARPTPSEAPTAPNHPPRRLNDEAAQPTPPDIHRQLGTLSQTNYPRE
ncbi:hypothetical protein GCM10009741_56770 [Kribbella lupini]|uniref:Uncharacterized protein n=1 Tax=Kribbella lupini TaxID=291602 RepID=A0ABN2BU04_9ACTN